MSGRQAEEDSLLVLPNVFGDFNFDNFHLDYLQLKIVAKEEMEAYNKNAGRDLIEPKG